MRAMSMYDSKFSSSLGPSRGLIDFTKRPQQQDHQQHEQQHHDNDNGNDNDNTHDIRKNQTGVARRTRTETSVRNETEPAFPTQERVPRTIETAMLPPCDELILPTPDTETTTLNTSSSNSRRNGKALPQTRHERQQQRRLTLLQEAFNVSGSSLFSSSSSLSSSDMIDSGNDKNCSTHSNGSTSNQSRKPLEMPTFKSVDNTDFFHSVKDSSNNNTNTNNDGLTGTDATERTNHGNADEHNNDCNNKNKHKHNTDPQQEDDGIDNNDDDNDLVQFFLKVPPKEQRGSRIALLREHQKQALKATSPLYRRKRRTATKSLIATVLSHDMANLAINGDTAASGTQTLGGSMNNSHGRRGRRSNNSKRTPPAA